MHITLFTIKFKPFSAGGNPAGGNGRLTPATPVESLLSFVVNPR